MGQADVGVLRRYATRLLAVAMVVGAGLAAREPSDSDAGVRVARFAFDPPAPLPRLVIPGETPRGVRSVHPSLRRISAWISSLGASVALADIDGDGLPNDVCHVDPRTNSVTIGMVPGTEHRSSPYPPFRLSTPPINGVRPETVAPTGILVGDFNEDGLADVLVYYWGRTPVIFLRSRPDGAPRADAYTPVELVPADSRERWFTTTAVQADLDGDGHVDLLVANYFPDGARILDDLADGTEVLHEGKANAVNGGAKHILLWRSARPGPSPDVQYAEARDVLPGIANHGWTLAVGAADLDGDLLPEVYLANDFGRDQLLHNRSTPGHVRFAAVTGERTFFTPKSCVLGHDSFKGMGCDFADLNDDGVPDIYVSNIATTFGLTESHFVWLSNGPAGTALRDGKSPYEQASERLGLSRSGWGWDCRFVDFDNDGTLEAVQALGFLKGEVNRWPELQALGTSNSAVVHDPRFWPSFRPGADLSGHDVNAFFVRCVDGRYHRVSPPGWCDRPMVSRGIAVADVDGDGRVDVAIANQWEESVFLRNRAPAAGTFLGVRPVLPVDEPPMATSATRTRPAIGAVVSVTLPDARVRTAQVDGGSGHSGRRAPEVHFGLGGVPPNADLPVEVRWRDKAGVPQLTRTALRPGWHTVILRPAAALGRNQEGSGQ